MLNSTGIRGMIGSVTMVTISRIAATRPRKASSSTIVRETIAKNFTMSLVKGKIGCRILRIRMKSNLKFTFLLKNQRESFHQSRHRLHKHNLGPNLREFIIQATEKFDDTIIITLFLNLGKQATCTRRSTGTDKNCAIQKEFFPKDLKACVILRNCGITLSTILNFLL